MPIIVSDRCARFARAVLTPVGLFAVVLAVCLAPPNFAEDPPPRADLDGVGIRNAAQANSNSTMPPGEVEVSSGEYDQLIVRIRGSEEGDKFGYSVAVANRLNLDAHQDLIIGAPKEANRGRAYVYHGPFTEEGPLLMTVEDAAMAFASPRSDDFDFGERVGVISDIDGDGAQDIRIRSWFNDAPSTVQMRTYVVSGFDGSPLFIIEGDEPFDPWAEISGDADGDGDVDSVDEAIVFRNFGLSGDPRTLGPWSGDVNGDGYVDAADLAMVEGNMGTTLFAVNWQDCQNPPDGFVCMFTCAGPLLIPDTSIIDCDPIRTCPENCACAIQVVPGVGSQGQYAVPRDTEIIVSVVSNQPVQWQYQGNIIPLVHNDGDTFVFIAYDFGWVNVQASYVCCGSTCNINAQMLVDCLGIPDHFSDYDNDGLPNYGECIAGLDWNFSDTDHDTMPEPWEFEFLFNPLEPDGDDDRDRDGIPNFLEYLYGSDPGNASVAVNAQDPDQDGIITWLELQYGTDPFDPDSKPAVDFTSGDMSWTLVNGTLRPLTTEIIYMCVGDSFRLHAAGDAQAWHIFRGAQSLHEQAPMWMGFSPQWCIESEGAIVIAASTPGLNGPVLGHLEIVAVSGHDCPMYCYAIMRQCDGSPVPAVASVGQQLCLKAIVPNQQPPTYVWHVLEETAAHFVDGNIGPEVILQIDEPIEFHVCVVKGICVGSATITAVNGDP